MLIPVTRQDLLEKYGIYFSPRTLRKWHHLKTFPELFVKIRSRLFVNLDVWNNLIKKAKGKNEDLKES